MLSRIGIWNEGQGRYHWYYFVKGTAPVLWRSLQHIWKRSAGEGDLNLCFCGRYRERGQRERIPGVGDGYSWPYREAELGCVLKDGQVQLGDEICFSGLRRWV